MASQPPEPTSPTELPVDPQIPSPVDPNVTQPIDPVPTDPHPDSPPPE